MTTFLAGLNNPNFVFSLGKTPPTSIMDLLFKARKYMNGKDALTAKGLMGNERKKKVLICKARRGITKIILQIPRLAKVV